MATTVAISGGSNAIGGAVNDKIQGKEISIKSVATDFIVGAAFGAVFEKLAPSLKTTLKNASGSIWKIATIGPQNRGFVYENVLKAAGKVKGVFKIDNFPTIDAFYKGVATSIKTLDTNAKTYLNGNLVYKKLKGYVDDLADFESAFRKGAAENGDDVIIRNGDVKKKVLEIGIPENATKGQLKQIEKIKSYAKTKNVDVKVRTVK